LLNIIITIIVLLKTPQDITQIFSTLFCEKKPDVTMYSSHTQLVAMLSWTMQQEKWKNSKKLEGWVGRWEVRQWWMATRKVSNLISHVTYTPHTLAPRLPDVCERNVFRFFRASASEKQHIISKCVNCLNLHGFALTNMDA